MTSSDSVLTSVEGGLGRITINHPRTLNALKREMVAAITAALSDFEQDEAVFCVLIEGAGERGLCAGGDLRQFYDACCSGEPNPLTDFRDQYRMNAQIAHYTKPLIAFMDGIVMGAGLGLSAHASFRVVTERTVAAMPEVQIGSVPDVGATYFLSRAPGELGTHVALTAARFGGADALMLGIADVLVPSEQLAELTVALRVCESRWDVSQALASMRVDPGVSALHTDREWIDPAYDANSVEEILVRLAASDAGRAGDAIAAMSRVSPTSLKVTLRALRDARGMCDLKACLAMELRIGAAVLRRPDFCEGIRAAIIDKDQAPRWCPNSLQGVTDETVDVHFRDLGDDELRF